MNFNENTSIYLQITTAIVLSNELSYKLNPWYHFFFKFLARETWFNRHDKNKVN